MKRTTTPCRSCGQPLVFLRTTTPGRLMPINAETVNDEDEVFDHKRHKSHFADCPAAASFRKKS